MSRNRRAKSNSLPVFSFEFYDSLSQSFSPQCDPEQRTHNLVNLALATLEKGNKIGRDKHSYTPSWASEYSVDVVSADLDGLDKPKKVLWVGMHGPHRDLSLTHDREQKLIVVTSSGLPEVEPEIELPTFMHPGGGHIQTKTMISALAGIFFDTPPESPANK